MSPESYNFLTQWANSPKLPEVVECKVKKVLKPLTKELSAYTISIEISEKKNGVYDIIFASEDAYVSVYEQGTSEEIYEDDRDFIAKRFVSKEGRRSTEFIYDVSVNHHKQGTQVFKTGSLSLDECPVEVFPLRRRK